MFIPDVRAKIAKGEEEFAAKVLKKDGTVSDITLLISGLTNEERTIILDGCLINYYAEQHKNA